MLAKLSLALLAGLVPASVGIARAQRVPTFEIRNGAGLCLDVHAPEIDRNGGRVQVWECNDFAQQRWQFVRADRHRSGIRF